MCLGDFGRDIESKPHALLIGMSIGLIVALAAYEIADRQTKRREVFDPPPRAQSLPVILNAALPPAPLLSDDPEPCPVPHPPIREASCTWFNEHAEHKDGIHHCYIYACARKGFVRLAAGRGRLPRPGPYIRAIGRTRCVGGRHLVGQRARFHSIQIV